MAMHIDDIVRPRKSEAEWHEHVTVLQDAVCHLLRRNEELRNSLRAVTAQPTLEAGFQHSDVSRATRPIA